MALSEIAADAKSQPMSKIEGISARDLEAIQPMSSVNTRENLQMRLDLVTPLDDSEIHFLDTMGEDDEQPVETRVSTEDDDDQPMTLAQLEELEEVIHGQSYQPDQYSQANITFHGSPAETHDEDSD